MKLDETYRLHLRDNFVAAYKLSTQKNLLDISRYAKEEYYDLLRKDIRDYLNLSRGDRIASAATFRDFIFITAKLNFARLFINQINEYVDAVGLKFKTNLIQGFEYGSERKEDKPIEYFQKNIKGAILINPQFAKRILQINSSFTPDQFYIAKQDNLCQWYGILYNDGQGWDVKRENYSSIKNHFLSFKGASSKFLIINGDKGCGKSTLLRRLCIDCLNEKVVILWLTNVRLFEESIPAIMNDFYSKYILIIDNWESHVVNKESGIIFLNQLSNLNNIKTVVSDYETSDKPYLLYKNSDNFFHLSSKDNLYILKELATKNTDLQNKFLNITPNPQFADNPLYVILFVIVNTHPKANLENGTDDYSFLQQFQEIIQNDLKRIFTINYGAGLTLFYWANVYKKYHLLLPWSGFANISNNFNSWRKKRIKGFDINNELCHLLSKYLYLEEFIIPSQRNNYICHFHHDLLAEDGLSQSPGPYAHFCSQAVIDLYKNTSSTLKNYNLCNDLYKIVCLENVGYPEEMEKNKAFYFSFDVQFNELLKKMYDDAETTSDENLWAYNLFWLICYFGHRAKKIYIKSIIKNIIAKGCRAKCIMKFDERISCWDFAFRKSVIFIDFLDILDEQAYNFALPPAMFNDLLAYYEFVRSSDRKLD